MDALFMHGAGSISIAVAIILGALISEDAGTVSAAALSAACLVDARLSFLSVVAGLWIGDLGVYGFARQLHTRAGTSGWISRTITRVKVGASGKGSTWGLAASRFFPGTRVPAYLSAAFNRMPFVRFASITVLTALIWALAVFGLVAAFPGQAHDAQQKLTVVGFAGLSVFAMLLAWKKWGSAARRAGAYVWQRVVRWEFWPAWIFYAPVTGMCAWLGIRYRGLALPTIANLNQRNGGIIGESKIEILRELMNSSPEFTADAYLVNPGRIEDRVRQLRALLSMHGIPLPFVLKPDTAQRGAGFRKIASMQEAEEYLAQVKSALVLQRYVAGPREAGIFYYRFPGTRDGKIFGITRKRFPTVTGDGVRTLKKLVDDDDRARFLRKAYLTRLGDGATRVASAGEVVRLVEAGNHCQGCIFEDGWDLHSEELRRSIDEISRKIPGFHIGRFDIRYASDAALRAGGSFQIIELNGAASEATNLYDAKNSIWTAYRTLYEQWRLIYAIGADNRKRGARPATVAAVWRD